MFTDGRGHYFRELPRLETTSPEGSVFRLEPDLVARPVERLDEPAADVPKAGETAHGPATLLYIEDNLANLSLVEAMLRTRPKWRTLPALQGQLGLELAREHAPGPDPSRPAPAGYSGRGGASSSDRRRTYRPHSGCGDQCRHEEYRIALEGFVQR